MPGGAIAVLPAMNHGGESLGAIAQIPPLGQTGETQRQTVTTHLNKIRSDLKLSHESLQFTDAK